MKIMPLSKPEKNDPEPPAKRTMHFDVSPDEFRLLSWAKNHLEPMDLNRWLRAQILKATTAGIRARIKAGKPVPQGIVELLDGLKEDE